MNIDPRIPDLSDELAELADAACNGTLSEEQQGRLEQLLLDDEAAQLDYVCYLNIHAQLHWRCRSSEFATANGSSDLEHPTPPRPRALRRRAWWAAASAAAAALAAIAFFAWYARDAADKSTTVAVSGSPDESSPVEVPLASYSDSLDAEWEATDGSTITGPSPPNKRLSAGERHLKRGVAQIQFDAGATATLAGRTEIELIDAQTIRLDRGQLAVSLRPEARGFVVQTPHADIVDKGTAFGVAVDDSGETFVQVYEGWVELSLHSGGTRRIWPQTALRISADGLTEPADVPFEPWRFVRSCDEAAAAKKGGVAVVRDLLEEDPNATVAVGEFLLGLQTKPVAPLHEGTIYQDFAAINDMEPSDFDVLVPALVELLGEESYVPGQNGQPIPLRDRAENALEFLAGFRPAGDDRATVWGDWWAAAAGRSRHSWLAERRGDFRDLLIRWGREDAPDYVHREARRAIEIAARSRDTGVLPILMERLRVEIERPDESALDLAAIVRCLGELVDETEWVPVVVPELVELARELNSASNTGEPPDEHSASCARRSRTLPAFVDTLDRLAGTQLGTSALRSLGPRFDEFEIDETAFDRWLEATKP